MSLRCVSRPVESILAYAELKAFARIVSDFERTIIEKEVIPAAIEKVEELTRRALNVQTWELTGSSFRELEVEDAEFGFVVRLHPSPLKGNVSVYYKNAAGEEQQLSSSVYDVELNEAPGFIVRKQGCSWPAVGSFRDAVRIRFDAGYEAGKIPAGLRLGLLLQAAKMAAERNFEAPMNIAPQWREVDPISGALLPYIVRL